MGKNIVTRRVIVGTEGVELVGENEKRAGVLIQQLGAGNVYIIGAKNKAITDGIKLATNGTYSDDSSTGAIFAVADAANQDVRVLVVGE